MIEGKHKQLCGREAVLLWGSAREVDGGIELESPKDAPDGIGSALLLVKWKPMQGAHITTETPERWGGGEEWRGPWLFVTGDPNFFYPAFYLRVYDGKIERGWSLGPTPEHQLIFDTTVAPVPAEPDCWYLHARCDQNGLHIGTFDEWWSSVTRAGINCATGTEMAWPPMWLGLYCEASRTRWVVEDLEQ